MNHMHHESGAHAAHYYQNDICNAGRRMGRRAYRAKRGAYYKP
jgi:hypothetical protein